MCSHRNSNSDFVCTHLRYSDFYRFVASAFDEPTIKLHFRTDAPIEMKALLFVGSQHEEKYGMARMKPGVSLYSRKTTPPNNTQNTHARLATCV